MSLGIKSSAFLRMFTMGSWIHDGFLDARWDPVFTMGSWIHDGFLDSQWVPGFIIGLNKSVVYGAQSEVKNKKSMPICATMEAESQDTSRSNIKTILNRNMKCHKMTVRSVLEADTQDFFCFFFFIPTPYENILLLLPFWGMIGRFLLRSLLRPLKICIPLRTSPKKSKKRQAIIQLLKIRSTPIALAARSADFFSPWIFQISIKNLSFRCGLSQKSRKNVKRKHVFQKNAFGCGRPQKSRKNVKRKHHFWKFGAPLSHFRPLGRIFSFLALSIFRWKTYHSAADVP